jgi:hypothetical protein
MFPTEFIFVLKRAPPKKRLGLFLFDGANTDGKREAKKIK